MAGGLEIALWDRCLPGHPVVSSTAECLEEEGHRVTHVRDTRQALPSSGVLWAQNNAAWYPEFRRLAALPRAGRRPTVVWHCEPLPPPRCSGLPRPRLHMREVAKILLRDLR